jgi:hypothetical protein
MTSVGLLIRMKSIIDMPRFGHLIRPIMTVAGHNKRHVDLVQSLWSLCNFLSV